MTTVYHCFLILAAYLLGSVPTSVWVGRKYYGIDVRDYGSGNAGATNTIRVLGLKAGIPVLLLDVLKGFLAVNLVHLTKYYDPGTHLFVNAELILGTAAVLGHIFPVYVGFKGGKGVATILGFLLGVQLIPTLLAIGVFALVLIFTKYVSLGSVLAGISFPISIILIFKVDMPSLILFSCIVALMLVVTHRKNIGRLLRGEEAKAQFLMKRSRRDED